MQIKPNKTKLNQMQTNFADFLRQNMTQDIFRAIVVSIDEIIDVKIKDKL